MRITASAGSRTTSRGFTFSRRNRSRAPQDSVGGSGKSRVWLGEVFEHEAQKDMIEVPLGKGKLEQVGLLGLDTSLSASLNSETRLLERGRGSTDVAMVIGGSVLRSRSLRLGREEKRSAD